jgi:hypothetical protein
MAAFLERYTIILADRQLCQAWAAVSDQARRKGRPIQTADAWIAAPTSYPYPPIMAANVLSARSTTSAR